MNKKEIVEAVKAWNPATGYPKRLDGALYARAKSLGPKGAADGFLAKIMANLARSVREYLESAKEEESELQETYRAIVNGETIPTTPTTFGRPKERLSLVLREQVASRQRDLFGALELYEAMAPEGDDSDDVTWIITDGNDPDICADGEFGVLVNGKAYLYYKHTSPGVSEGVRYRPVNKREFGEVIRRPGETSRQKNERRPA